MLRLAEALFEVLVTMDKGIHHQQNLKGRRLTIIALQAKPNRLAETSVLLPESLAPLPTVGPGTFHSVGAWDSAR